MRYTPQDVDTTSAPLGDVGTVLSDIEDRYPALRSIRARTRTSAKPAEADSPPKESDVVELEVSPVPARTVELSPLVTARMEYNLTRTGIWAIEPNRDPRRLKYHYETEDLLGSLTVEMSLGQLSTFEMELVAWILGRWQPDGVGVVRFSLRQCAKDFGVKWSGQWAEFLRQALDRIDGTRFRSNVWNAVAKRRQRDRFGIFDHLQILDRADSLEGPALDVPTVTIVLNSFLCRQLQANHFAGLDWQVLRQQIKTPLGKRLYVFLEGQKGFRSEGGIAYEVTIDEPLMESLGCRDRQARRFRAKLVRAGQEIMAADQRYQDITVVAGRKRTFKLGFLRTA